MNTKKHKPPATLKVPVYEVRLVQARRPLRRAEDSVGDFHTAAGAARPHQAHRPRTLRLPFRQRPAPRDRRTHRGHRRTAQHRKPRHPRAPPSGACSMRLGNGALAQSSKRPRPPESRGYREHRADHARCQHPSDSRTRPRHRHAGSRRLPLDVRARDASERAQRGLSVQAIRRAPPGLRRCGRAWRELLVVGGAAMAVLYGARPTIKDVDVYIAKPEETAVIRRAAVRVAETLGLPERSLGQGSPSPPGQVSQATTTYTATDLALTSRTSRSDSR